MADKIVDSEKTTATATLVTIIFGVIALPTTAYGYYQISKDKAMHDEVKRAFATLWAKFPWASGRPEDDVEFIPPQPKLSDINRNFNRRLDDVEKGLALLNAAMDTDDLKKVIEALKKPINDINDTLRKQARERLEKLLEVAMAHKREAESNASGGSEQGTAATAGVKAKPMSDKRARFLTELREEREKKGKEKQAAKGSGASSASSDNDTFSDAVEEIQQPEGAGHSRFTIPHRPRHPEGETSAAGAASTGSSPGSGNWLTRMEESIAHAKMHPGSAHWWEVHDWAHAVPRIPHHRRHGGSGDEGEGPADPDA